MLGLDAGELGSVAGKFRLPCRRGATPISQRRLEPGSMARRTFGCTAPHAKYRACASSAMNGSRLVLWQRERTSCSCRPRRDGPRARSPHRPCRACRWEFIHKLYRPATTRFWIPDGFFGGAGDALDLTAVGKGVAGGEHLFVNTYLSQESIAQGIVVHRDVPTDADLCGRVVECRSRARGLLCQSPGDRSARWEELSDRYDCSLVKRTTRISSSRGCVAVRMTSVSNTKRSDSDSGEYALLKESFQPLSSPGEVTGPDPTPARSSAYTQRTAPVAQAGSCGRFPRTAACSLHPGHGSPL